jgi:hypothetical protein
MTAGRLSSVDVPLVRDGLFTVDPPALLGGCCQACEQYSFPAAARCPHCRGGHVEVRALPTTGTIYSYTIARVRAPGYLGPVPYGYGLVSLDVGIQVASLLGANPIERLSIGARVRFGLVDVGTAEQPLWSYAYEVEHS